MRRSRVPSGDRFAENVDGRVKPGRDETVGRPRCTQKSVGIRELTPRISAVVIPYREDSTKARLAAGTARFLRKPLGDRQFRAFAVRETMVMTSGCGQAPRASFCVLKVWCFGSGLKS